MPTRARTIFTALACLSGLLGVVAWVPTALASVTLSVRVARGGFDLDFGTVSPGGPPETRELELTLTSTGGGRYRVYQEMPNFLINERGARLPEGILVMQISRGMTGTPSSGGIVPVTSQPQELFVSNPSGQSDTLLLVYSLQQSAAALPSGTYRGVLRFSVESADTGAIATERVNVRVVVPSILALERLGISPGRLSFGSLDPGSRSQPVQLALGIRNNTNVPTEVTQEVLEPLSNGQGDTLPLEAIEYTIVSDQGSLPARPIAGTSERLLVDDRGHLRQFHLSYAAAIPASQRAGDYRGTLRLRVTSPGVTAADVQLPMELKVNEVFAVSVKPADGHSSLNFGRTSLTGEPVERTMVVEIRTNLGRPYKVLAGLDHPLVLPTGETLPERALVWSVSSVEPGAARIGPGGPVPVGYEPLYESDAKGSPATFMLHYRLTVPLDAPPGLYSGQIRFSATFF